MENNLRSENIESVILENQEKFEKILNDIKNEKNIKKKVKLAKRAIKFSLTTSTGYYSSDIIENVFISIASDIHCDCRKIDYKKGTILHVMTRSYLTGGHTRVVERWISLSDDNLKHSVVFTSSKEHEIPNYLKKVVAEKNGNLISLPNNPSEIKRGLELRKIASSYEFVILHVHPFDIIPLIAFGNKEFSRPIIFFNHADHKFWLGASVSDFIVNFREWGEDLCKNRRGIATENNFLVGLPIDHINSVTDFENQYSLRKEFGLPLDGKIILTIGSAHKYDSLPVGISYVNIIDDLLKEQKNIMFIFVGPRLKDLTDWNVLFLKYPDRILALGPLHPSNMFKYIKASDIVLDSYPMSGGTALLDAVSCSKPVLSLNNPVGQLDYILKSVAYCDNKNDFLNKIKTILSNNDFYMQNIQDVKNKLNGTNCIDIRKSRINDLYLKATRVHHSIYKFSPKNQKKITPIDIYLDSEYKRKNLKFDKFCLKIYTSNSEGKKYIKIDIFNLLKIKFRFFMRSWFK